MNLIPTSRQSIVDGVIWRTVRDLASPRSQQTYSDQLRGYFRWHYDAYKNQTIPCADSVYAYRQYLIDEGRAPASIQVALAAIRKMAQTALESNEAPAEWANPILKIASVPRRGSVAGNWLSLASTKELLDRPDRSTLEGQRDYTILALMVGAGLRRAEVAGLQLGQIADRQGWLCCCDFMGKGGKVATVPLPKGEVSTRVQEFTARYRDFTKSAAVENADALPLIPSFYQKRIQWGVFLRPNSLNRIIGRYTSDIAPHDLRRTFAGLAYKANVDVARISTALRHSNVAVTQRYLGAIAALDCPVAGAIGL